MGGVGLVVGWLARGSMLGEGDRRQMGDTVNSTQELEGAIIFVSLEVQQVRRAGRRYYQLCLSRVRTLSRRTTRPNLDTPPTEHPPISHPPSRRNDVFCCFGFVGSCVASRRRRVCCTEAVIALLPRLTIDRHTHQPMTKKKEGKPPSAATDPSTSTFPSFSPSSPTPHSPAASASSSASARELVGVVEGGASWAESAPPPSKSVSSLSSATAAGAPVSPPSRTTTTSGGPAASALPPPPRSAAAEHDCEVCGKPAASSCSSCGTTRYCTRA